MEDQAIRQAMQVAISRAPKLIHPTKDQKHPREVAMKDQAIRQAMQVAISRAPKLIPPTIDQVKQENPRANTAKNSCPEKL